MLATGDNCIHDCDTLRDPQATTATSIVYRTILVTGRTENYAEEYIIHPDKGAYRVAAWRYVKVLTPLCQKRYIACERNHT